MIKVKEIYDRVDKKFQTIIPMEVKFLIMLEDGVNIPVVLKYVTDRRIKKINEIFVGEEHSLYDSDSGPDDYDNLPEVLTDLVYECLDSIYNKTGENDIKIGDENDILCNNIVDKIFDSIRAGKFEERY